MFMILCRMLVRTGAVALVLLMLMGGSVFAAEGPILIGSIFAHTGKAAEENTPNYLMARMAAQSINKSGGVLGRRIRLIELDNQSSVLGARQAAVDAVNAGVVAVVGPSWSSHAMAMAPIFQKAGIPMVGATTTSPKVTQVGDFIFRACYTDKTQASALARFAYEDLGARRVSMLVVAGDVFSEGIADFFKQDFEEMGGRVVNRYPYLLSSMDFGKQLASVETDKVDLLLVPGFARDSGLIIMQARKMGLTIPILGGDGWAALEQYPYVDELKGDNYFSSHWHPDTDTPESRSFVRLMKKELGDNVLNLIDSGNPVAYDALQLLAEAIRRAGSAEPKDIRDSLATLKDFKAVTGTISYAGSRDPVKPVVLLRIENHSVQFVKTVRP
ncbi:ABC transporter substrate-binding protein [Salidesulfovibrio brasiliensis]|uniref:ABC transporter substrate-binding protein n=1 Tax=Salidesulfovibrio brasiliensis TaxID=221711 RepID=UPI0006D2C445|nr:ABC transporter substrate-binding protein [Salidesulfovibrio brasiliensis]